MKFRQGFCVILLLQFNPTDYIQSLNYLKGSLQSVSIVNKATAVFVLWGLVLSSVLLDILPVFMGGDGIWWGGTLAEVLAALAASEIRTKRNTGCFTELPLCPDYCTISVIT